MSDYYAYGGTAQEEVKIEAASISVVIHKSPSEEVRLRRLRALNEMIDRELNRLGTDPELIRVHVTIEATYKEKQKEPMEEDKEGRSRIRRGDGREEK